MGTSGEYNAKNDRQNRPFTTEEIEERVTAITRLHSLNSPLERDEAISSYTQDFITAMQMRGLDREVKAFADGLSVIQTLLTTEHDDIPSSIEGAIALVIEAAKRTGQMGLLRPRFGPWIDEDLRERPSRQKPPATPNDGNEPQ